MIERRKLFSENSTPLRRKLFCEDDAAKNASEHRHTTPIICSDCGHKMETLGTTYLICPKCGGDRFDVQRRSLFEDDFQKTFSDTTNPFELKLKKFSGKEISKNEFEKEFSDLCSLEDLQERGYASVSDEGIIKFSDTAFLEARTFSKIVVSITKEYDLIPEIMEGCDKGRFIDRLDASPKCIAILKKVHGIKPDGENWIDDSGILNDLPAEFGSVIMPEDKLKNIIETRYPDAPEDLLSLLMAKGIISSTGDNKIEIIK